VKLRPYQAAVLDSLWNWFHRHEDGNPIVVAAVGAGKSLMIAALAQRADAEYPGTRVLVLVHQKELLEQNVDKIVRVWPEANVGIFSAAVGLKQLGCQITYATIGSIYKKAHELGRIDIVLADECHMINPKSEGMWRSFLDDLAKYCPHARTIGWTGTEFRGNGVFLTAGDKALFTHVAAKITMKELLDLGYLAPLVPAVTQTKVVAEDVPRSGDDYVVAELAKVTDREELVESTCDEIVQLAADRKRWLVFAVTIEHAGHVKDALIRRGVVAEMVSAETPKAERAQIIGAFREGRIRCLVNVAVLTTGFDVPAVDFIALLRATQSPVLYVQIAGRGMRLLGQTMEESIANGKADCLFADFTDTTSRLGPVDLVKGRAPRGGGSGEAPFKICPNCGSRNTAAAIECLDCGHQFPPKELIKHGDKARGAAVLSSQLPKEKVVEVSGVIYCAHYKEGSVPSLRVEYWSGLACVAKEWIFLDHQGYLRLKAEKWWRMRALYDGIPRNVADAVVAANGGAIRAPSSLKLSVGGKHPEILQYFWENITA